MLAWVETLRPGQHLCCLYQTEDEHRAVVTAFVRQGLEHGHKVLYLVDARTAQGILDYLRDDGLAVQSCVDSGQLAISAAADTYLQDGRFDPRGMIALLRAEVEAALSEGYTALRVTGEMSWALRGSTGSKELFEYEALLNEFLPQVACLAICQYDRRLFAPELLLDVIATHPFVVVGTELYDNFYYIPPAEFLGDDLPGATLDHWLGNLADRKRIDAELARHRGCLEAQVQERTSELLRLNEQLQREEAALRESEERYRLLAENATDMISRHALDGTYLYASPACHELLGYEPDELLGRDAYDLFHPEDTAAIRQSHGIVLETTGGAQVEYRLRRKDGSYIWVETTSKAVRDSQSGELLEIVAITRDIAARRAAQEALTEAEERSRAIVAALPDIIFRITRDGTYLDFRAPEEDLLAAPPDQFVGRRMTDLEVLPAPLVARTLETIARALDTGTLQTFEYSLQVPRGTGYFENRIVPSGDDEVINIIRNITDRRQAEMRLEERTAQLEALREVGLSLIAQLDLDALLHSIVSWAVRLLDASYGDFYLYQPETDQLHWMAGVGPETMAVKNVLVRGEGLSGRAWDAGQLLVVDDYSRYPGQLSEPGAHPAGAVIAIPIYWREQFLGVLDVMAEPPRTFTTADTSLLTMFAVQAAVAIANAQLFSAVQEQREQLRTLASRLAEVEEAERRRLARELHDQVGQNMTALGINLNIIASQLPEDVGSLAGPRLEDTLALIEQTTERIRGIMGELRPPVLDDYGLIAALRWYAEQFTRRTGIPVDLHDRGGGIRLPARVENSLFRIAQEALTNVAKHADAHQVVVSLDVGGDSVRLEIADDGVGFHPGRATGAKGRQGWGLLSMAERAESLAGQCRIQSSPGQGAQVVVEAPL
ncbi:MAG: MEDS domain-containing protein [Anaerolineae bacterium]